MMKVFLSWSGERSRQAAHALKEWLPDVLQQVETWLSEHDIDAGTRWAQRISEVLAGCNIGIILLTPENQKSPWLLFEAGALSKSVEQSRVIPFLIDMNPADVESPLSQFQVTRSNKEGMRRLLESINSIYPVPLSEERLLRQLDKWWPDLENKISKISIRSEKNEALPSRTDRELLEELLELIRPLNTSSYTRNKNNIFTFLIDTRPLFGGKGNRVTIDVPEEITASEFLDSVYFKINEHNSISAYKYGEKWLLKNMRTGELLDNIGIEYCRSRGVKLDNTPIVELNLENYDHLCVVPVEKAL